MARKQPPRKVGRPKSDNPLSVGLNVRITPEVREAIASYRAKHAKETELHELSDAVRHILKRVLRDEGLLK